MLCFCNESKGRAFIWSELICENLLIVQHSNFSFIIKTDCCFFRRFTEWGSWLAFRCHVAQKNSYLHSSGMIDSECQPRSWHRGMWELGCPEGAAAVSFSPPGVHLGGRGLSLSPSPPKSRAVSLPASSPSCLCSWIYISSEHMLLASVSREWIVYLPPWQSFMNIIFHNCNLDTYWVTGDMVIVSI